MDTPNPISGNTNIDTNVSMEPIHYVAEMLTQARVQEFIRATGTDFAGSAFPLTFATIFRKAEFLWLDRMKVDLRNLLHTDQEYDYLSPFEVGDVPEVSTRITHWKERRGMVFVTLESKIAAAGVPRVLATTTFVLRPNKVDQAGKVEG